LSAARAAADRHGLDPLAAVSVVATRQDDEKRPDAVRLAGE
jgi:hypothetical protein